MCDYSIVCPLPFFFITLEASSVFDTCGIDENIKVKTGRVFYNIYLLPIKTEALAQNSGCGILPVQCVVV